MYAFDCLIIGNSITRPCSRWWRQARFLMSADFVTIYLITVIIRAWSGWDFYGPNAWRLLLRFVDFLFAVKSCFLGLLAYLLGFLLLEHLESRWQHFTSMRGGNSKHHGVSAFMYWWLTEDLWCSLSWLFRVGIPQYILYLWVESGDVRKKLRRAAIHAGKWLLEWLRRTFAYLPWKKLDGCKLLRHPSGTLRWDKEAALQLLICCWDVSLFVICFICALCVVVPLALIWAPFWSMRYTYRTMAEIEPIILWIIMYPTVLWYINLFTRKPELLDEIVAKGDEIIDWIINYWWPK